MGSTTLEKSKLIETVTKDLGSVSDTNIVEDTANKVITDVSNSVSTAVGQITEQVTGGVKSLTSKTDAFQDKLNSTTAEGLLTDGVESLENMTMDMVADTIVSLTSIAGLGSTVVIEFTDPDSNGIVHPLNSSLVAPNDEGTIADILKLITGLGVGPGSLQQMVAEASPAGLLSAGKDLDGKLGAFTSDIIQELSTAAITSVTNEINDLVGTVVDINRVLSPITGYDSALGGVFLRGSAITSTGPTADSEYNASISKVSTLPIADIASKFQSSKQVKQNLNGTGVVNDLENLSGGTNGKEVLSSVQSEADTKSQYVRITDEGRSLVQTRSGNNGLGIIQSLSAEILTDLKQKVQSYILPSVVSDNVIYEIISGAQGDAQQLNDTIIKVSKLNNKLYPEIKTFLRTIDSTMTTTIRGVSNETVFEPPYVIGSYEQSWNKGKSNDMGVFSFPYISSIEELHAELRNIKREVTEFVVHWTETPTNKNIGSEEINQWHLEAGLEGIGYHYVCRRDGSLQRGRPSNIEGQHAEFGHNSRSISFVFVGGLNIPSGTPNVEDFVSVQSLTRSQFNTFDHFCRSFYSVWSGGQALGHNDLSGQTIEPDFDVKDYVLANFGKSSLYTTLGKDPAVHGPFTTGQINESSDLSIADLLGF